MTKTLNLILKICQVVGFLTLNTVSGIGKIVSFTINSLINIFTPPYYPKEIKRHFIEIGFYSLPVVSLTALFSGMVLALQSYVGFSSLANEDIIANILTKSIVRELGPVLACLMIAGRVSGSVAAEISTMKTTEQINALHILSTNPVKYLISPRLLVAMTAIPILVFIASIIAILGGTLVAVFKLNLNYELFVQACASYLNVKDIILGLTKGFVFGVIIVLSGSYFGYYAKEGAKGVGVSTTNAVVISSILIFVSNYVTTYLFFNN